eukprot:scaffold27982_cov31-Tisochrysis_lutea.AAC.3
MPKQNSRYVSSHGAGRCFVVRRFIVDRESKCGGTWRSCSVKSDPPHPKRNHIKLAMRNVSLRLQPPSFVTLAHHMHTLAGHPHITRSRRSSRAKG